MAKKGSFEELYYENKGVEEQICYTWTSIDSEKINLEKVGKNVEQKKSEFQEANKNVEKIKSHKGEMIK